MDKFTKALHFRHACKVFDETKKISANDANFILEAGRLSPSSFGLEPWHFLVITDQKLKEIIRPACWNQLQITSCSHLIIVLFRKESQFNLDSTYIRNAMARKFDKSATEGLSQRFVDYAKNELSDNNNVNNWSEMQCYIAAGNMMTAAAYINIDSCAIGGFQYKELEKILEQHVPMFKKDEFGIALGLAFGYRLNEQSEQIRWLPEDVITFI